MTTSLRSKFFRVDIQILRGISILGVLFFHLPNTKFNNGFLGVDVFFVISGFLITPRIFRIFTKSDSLTEAFQGLIKFAKARLLRLSPAFATTIIVFTPLILLLGDLNLVQRVLMQGIAGLFILGNFGAYKFSGDYFHPNLGNPLVHFWSLSVEEQFYFLLPLLIFFAFIFIKKRINIFANFILGLLFVISLVCFIFPNLLTPMYGKFFAVPESFAFYSPISRFWEFAIGGFIGLKPTSSFKKPLADYLRVILCGSLVSILFLPLSVRSSILTVMVVLLTALIISTESLNILPKSILTFLGFMGDRSYSIYLVHLPIIYLVLQSPVSLRNSLGDSVFIVIAAVGLSIIVGDLSFRYVELKFNNDKFISSKPLLLRFHLKFAVFPLVLVIALNTISSTDYFGLVKDSNSTNPGVLFKEVCKRENFTHQFPCILNNVPGRPSVALIGDSHATQYSLILQQISREMKFRLVMLGSIGGELDSTRTVAALMREKPEILIVSKFWLSSDFAKNSSFLESEDLLRKFSDKIIIVGQNPVFQNDDFVSATGGSALIDYIFNLDEGKSRVSHSRKFDGSAKVAGKSILKWAEFRNIRFIDPKLALCVDADCSNLASSSDYFFDNNHLSVIGAAKTKFLFKNALSNSLPNLN